MAITEPQDAICYVQIDGVDYAAREHRYQASVLKLADAFAITIPALNGKVLASDGSQTPIANVATMGAPVVLSMSDPNVQGGQRLPKLKGLVTGRRMVSGTQDGTILAVTGADLGWKLSSCGRVKTSLRGLTWVKFLQKFLGMTVGPSQTITTVTGDTFVGEPSTSDVFGWGIAGVRAGNLLNRRIKLGRQAVQIDYQQQVAPTIIQPPIQVEVGQTVDSLLIEYARINRFLVNVSADGWLQFFQPSYAQKPLYSFYRYADDDERRKQNNVMRPEVNESGESQYTHVECWSTVIDRTNEDQFDPNWGRYHGSYDNTAALPFERRYTFTDDQQLSQDLATARAKWQWQRFAYDGWSYTFETVGHSQGGIPFAEDTMCELHDLVFGIEGTFYVDQIECTRKLARAGVDENAGTRTKITLRKPGILAA